MSKINTELLTTTEQLALSQLLSKVGTSIDSLNKVPHRNLSEDYIKKCISLRAKYQQMAIEDGVTLPHIFTASLKRFTSKKNGSK